MPLPKPLLEEMAVRRATENELAERDKLRDYILSALQCLGWCALGVFCILWSAHTTSMTWGRAAFYGGIGIGNGGILFTLLAAYRRGEQRGDW